PVRVRLYAAPIRLPLPALTSTRTNRRMLHLKNTVLARRLKTVSAAIVLSLVAVLGMDALTAPAHTPKAAATGTASQDPATAVPPGTPTRSPGTSTTTQATNATYISSSGTPRRIPTVRKMNTYPVTAPAPKHGLSGTAWPLTAATYRTKSSFGT